MDHPQLQFDLVDITEAAYAYVMKSLMKETYMPPMHLRQSHVLLINRILPNFVLGWLLIIATNQIEQKFFILLDYLFQILIFMCKVL